MVDVITVFLSLVASFVAVCLFTGIRILKEWDRLPVLRLGRYVGLRGPGLAYLFPLIDRGPIRISTRLDTIQFRTESTLTKDNVPVNVDAVLYMKPVDLEKAVLQVENYFQATQFASQTTLREVIGKINLNDLLAEREKVGAKLREIIDEKTEAWGIKVTTVEVRAVIIPLSLQDAMSRQAQAERERIARVTLATAEYEASQKMIEAAKAYENSAEGLQIGRASCRERVFRAV
jgi:regulator of protease activity HflC (stomatin/prohibitin superfamily)